MLVPDHVEINDVILVYRFSVMIFLNFILVDFIDMVVNADSEVGFASNIVLYTLTLDIFGESLDDICPIIGLARVNMLIHLMLIAVPWV